MQLTFKYLRDQKKKKKSDARLVWQAGTGHETDALGRGQSTATCKKAYRQGGRGDNIPKDVIQVPLGDLSRLEPVAK